MNVNNESNDRSWIENIKQKEAINTINGPVMVVSCAGSGKTTVILERTNKIIKSGVSASSILVVTFSKAAAEELKERFVQKYHTNGVKFATIHSVCYSILAKIYNLNTSSILNEDDKRLFFYGEYAKLKTRFGRKILENYRDIDDFQKDMESKISKLMLLMYKTQSKNFNDFYNNSIDEYTNKVFLSYLDFKKSSGVIDYDDMIIECHKYLKSNPDILKLFKTTYKYIMIDEYQDTSVLQSEIFFMLCNNRNICVVGDDDQSIYSFRGADGSIFKNFLKEYPDAKRIFLEINYRSQPLIIHFASNLISRNIERFNKKFKTSRRGNANIEYIKVNDSVEQSNKVIEIIKECKQNNIPLNQIAILYRLRKESSVICNSLILEEIPFYTKEPPEDIHKGMVYQDIQAYYRLANNIYQKTDLRRIINRPKRYIKSDKVGCYISDKFKLIENCTKDVNNIERKERIKDVINQLFIDLNQLRGKKPTSFMKYLSNNMKYRDFLIEYANYLKIDSNIFTVEFDILMAESQKFQTMEQWNNYAKEYKDKLIKAMEKNKENGVYLSTFHSAKGLEWSHVIIISANEKITPLERNGIIENPEEERRLFYVAMTRARDELSIISIEDTYGTLPSRYITEMQVGKI